MTTPLRDSSSALGSARFSAQRLGPVATALVIGILAFTFRFNVLGGALGGFDNDQFIYLVRTDLVLQGEQPLRDFADAELRGAWPALTYLASAWAQQLGGRTLLSEAYLTVGALAVAHALVFLLALDLSRRWSMALLASAATIVMVPKLYNYPKLLMLALGIYALTRAVRSPSTTRLGVLAAITVVAALFRHDLGAYIGVSAVVAFVVRDLGRWRVLLRTVGTYSLLTLLCGLPSLVSVQVYEGIVPYVSDSLESVAVERARTTLYLPSLDMAAPFTGESLLLVTYYVFWAIPAVAACALIGRHFLSSASSNARTGGAVAAGLLMLGVLTNQSFLRANLAERFGDSVVPVVLLAACTVGGTVTWSSGLARAVATTLPFLLVLQILGAGYSFSEVAHELDTSGLSDSWGKIGRRYQAVNSELAGLPPSTWSAPGDTAVIRAAGYVARCTRVEDRLLVTGAIHEVPVLARRRIASGQALFKLSFYTSERAQLRALATLRHQSVPLVLADAREFEGGFLADYPLVAEYLRQNYREAGRIDVPDEPGMVVFVDNRRTPTGVDAQVGLPCFG